MDTDLNLLGQEARSKLLKFSGFILIFFLGLWKKNKWFSGNCLAKGSSCLEEQLSSNVELFFQNSGEEHKTPES